MKTSEQLTEIIPLRTQTRDLSASKIRALVLLELCNNITSLLMFVRVLSLQSYQVTLCPRNCSNMVKYYATQG